MLARDPAGQGRGGARGAPDAARADQRARRARAARHGRRSSARSRGGELLLLCSDGLHGALDDKALEAVLASGRTSRTMADELVRLALERDGSDNITALVVTGTRVALARWLQTTRSPPPAAGSP